MELLLKRTYYPVGTNGILTVNDVRVCHTIELPWKNNRRIVSCIPEGIYALKKRFSRKFSWHIELLDVPDRELILIHPANYALKELKGCIAPVFKLSGAGVGFQSRAAFGKLRESIYRELELNRRVDLIVES